MADEQTEATADKAQERAARRGSQSSPASTPDEVRYSVEDLLENPALLGVSRHAIAGALHDADRKTFTLAGAEKAVNAFLKREPVSEGDEV